MLNSRSASSSHSRRAGASDGDRRPGGPVASFGAEYGQRISVRQVPRIRCFVWSDEAELVVETVHGEDVCGNPGAERLYVTSMSSSGPKWTVTASSVDGRSTGAPGLGPVGRRPHGRRAPILDLQRTARWRTADRAARTAAGQRPRRQVRPWPPRTRAVVFCPRAMLVAETGLSWSHERDLGQVA